MVSCQRSNFVSKLHSQEEEVRHQQAANDKLAADNKAILGDIDNLEHQKKDLLNENAQLEKRLKDLKGQVEMEVSGLETLLGSAPREASVLETEVGMGKTDEESADDSEAKDSDDSKDDSKDDDSADDKDDDNSDDKDDAKQSLAKTDSKAKDSKSDAKADDKDDDADDDKDDSDDSDDDTPEDGIVTADVQVGEDADDSCRCVTACNKAPKPICFVNSASCKLKANCDKGAKGTAGIKQDPVKGPGTFCSTVRNNATVPKEKPEKEDLLPENPNVAVALRMLADVKREIVGITNEDGDGARKLREAYRDEKSTEEHK